MRSARRVHVLIEKGRVDQICPTDSADSLFFEAARFLLASPLFATLKPQPPKSKRHRPPRHRQIENGTLADEQCSHLPTSYFA